MQLDHPDHLHCVGPGMKGLAEAELQMMPRLVWLPLDALHSVPPLVMHPKSQSSKKC